MSFQATIKFALLALAMLFTANLWVLPSTQAPSNAWGVAFAIAATALAYAAQSYFTQVEFIADQARSNLAVVGYAGPTDPNAESKAQSAAINGMALQLASILFGLVSGVLFLWGVL